MYEEQQAASNQLSAESLDLEAQRARCPKATHEREIRTPDGLYAISHVSFRPTFKDTSMAEEWTGRDNPSILGARFDQNPKDSPPVSEHEEINLKDFEKRYRPQYTTEARAGLSDVLTFLHHNNLDYLREKLLKQYSLIAASAEIYSPARESALDSLQKDLAAYVKAEKNYQTWIDLPLQEQSRQNESIYPRDPPKIKVDVPWVEHLASIECATFYNLHGEKKMLQKRKTLTEVDMPQQSAEKRKTIERKRKELEEKRRFASRAIAAVFGGLAIIAPMLIMSLHPTKLTQLLTASLFVVSVALVLARLMEDAERKDMIAATAAYAAVLAVFVGAATTTS